ncbi:hypothetical protein R80B4_01716 [Fibrobacteres bacterium R8-0-B4]
MSAIARCVRALSLSAAAMSVFIFGCGGDDGTGGSGGGGGNNTCTSGGTCRKVTIGTQTWMTENLNIATEGSWCYGNSPANCAKYGRLYTWTDAMTACPSGWHLPANQEWEILTDYAGSKKLHARSGWENSFNGLNGNGTDDFGFAALPGGYCNASRSCGGAGEMGFWWTSTEDVNGRAYNRAMAFADGVESKDTTLGLSVRCIAN